MRTFIASLCAVAAAALASPASAADDALSRAELSRLGKAATVYVENGHGSGSGFCVHPSGLFITNEHVVAGAETLTVVIDSNLKTQKVVTAKVVRSDKELDLALVRADGVKDLPALSLGSVDKIAETMEVMALGFPFGKLLDGQPNEYPAVSVNVGGVTSLRLKDGALHRIQVDATLNPGNSGGPVLGPDGKVVGVVVAGLRGTGVNFVIPVSHLTTFLAKPEFDFQPPALTRATVGAAVEFRARTMPLLPGGKPFSLELVLTGEDGKARSFPMEKDGDGYHVKAIPAPAPDGPVQVRATFTYADGSVTGLVADRTLSIGGKPYKLSELRSLRWQPAFGAVAVNGTVLNAAVGGLDGVDVDLGKEIVHLKLEKVLAAQLEQIGGVKSVACSVVVRQDEKEIHRVSSTLTVSDPVADFPGDQAVGPGAIRPPTLAQDAVVVKLPDVADDMVVGGGGRFLIFRVPKLHQIAIFDVNEAKVVKLLPLGADDALLAAGLNKLMVVQPRDPVVQRWNLTTFERETTAKLTMEVPPIAAALGSASNGPLVISGVDFPRLGETAIFDIQKMRRIETAINPRIIFATSPEVRLRASADGRLFACQQYVIGAIQTCVRTGGEFRQYGGDGGVSPAPGPDGKVIYTSRGLYTDQMKKIRETAFPCIPACQGPYYIGFPQTDGVARESGAVSLYAEGEARPFAELTAVEGAHPSAPPRSTKLTLDKRVFLIPDAMLLATLAATDDKLVLRHVDVGQLLGKSDLDYLLVTSRPPDEARKGEEFAYQVQVKCRKGGLKYKLDASPPGMTIDASGRILWKAPIDLTETEVAVIVVVTNDAGREITHSFLLSVAPQKKME